MTLTLYNTLTRRKEAFQPIDPANVRMYVCGPTVYDFAHIGNARPVIVFDVLFRLLRHLYGPEHVTYARNITDVDDKINARAVERYPELPPTEAIAKLTAETTEQFHKDIAALGVFMPEDVNKPGQAPLFVEPRATQSIAEMRALIELLVANRHAYVAESHVLFDVPTMPDYGRLANRSLDEMEAGARVDVAPYKKGPMDFVLWKPSKPGEPAWDSPAGIAAPGRPGWHIECSAMADRWLWQEAKASLSAAGLAQPHVFDIHGGGIDLVFPHHENEVAQSRCAHGTAAMANMWMHNGFLQVEGEKMSKSLGNFVTINDLLTGWQNVSWPGGSIRLALLQTHYRQPMDFTRQRLEDSLLKLADWFDVVGSARSGYKRPVPSEFVDVLSDDLNTPAAYTFLNELEGRARKGSDIASADLWHCLGFLGIDIYSKPVAHLSVRGRKDRRVAVVTGDHEINRIDSLRQLPPIEQRRRIEEIEGLVAARNAARKAKNFKEADRIRDELSAMGIQLKDAKDPATGEIVTTWEVRASSTTEVKR